MGIEWGYPKTWSTLHEDLNRWQGINQQSWEYLNPNGHRPQLHLSKNHCRWRWRLASHSVHLLDVHAPPNCCDIFTVKISIYIYIHIYTYIHYIYISYIDLHWKFRSFFFTFFGDGHPIFLVSSLRPFSWEPLWTLASCRPWTPSHVAELFCPRGVPEIGKDIRWFPWLGVPQNRWLIIQNPI